MKPTSLLLTLILTCIFLLPESFAQRPDLIVSDIYRLGTLEQGPGNKIDVMIANIGGATSASFQVILTVKQGRSVQMKKVTMTNGIGAQNHGFKVSFTNIQLSSSRDINVTAEVDPGKKVGEVNENNNKRTKSFSVESADVQDGSATITTKVYHYGTWGYQGSGTYKAIQNARVTIYANGAAQGAGWTNSAGVWEMGGLNQGTTYTVEVSKNGFKKRGVTFKLSILSKLVKVPLKP